MEHVIRIDASRIRDWGTFHSVFQNALGFPGYYGRNMDAWIDCLTYADDAQAGMVATPVPRGKVLTLLIEDAGRFRNRCPEQYDALIEGSAAVNNRRIEQGEPAVLVLAMS
jgi:hypothetical protein